MSWDDKDIDNLFRNVKTPEPPPFEEAFWTEMEAQLPPQKRRKAIIWWFSGGAALLVLVCGALFLNTMTSGRDAVPVKTTDLSPEKENGQASVQPQQSAVPLETAGYVADAGTLTKNDAGTVKGIVNREIPQPVKTKTIVPLVKKASSPMSISKKGDIPEEMLETDRIADLAFNQVSLPKGGKAERYLTEGKVSRPERFYIQVGAGVGQSALKNVYNASDIVHFYALGGGLQTNVDRTILSFGVNFRVDFTQNIMSSQSLNENNTHSITTQYKQLYSFETPLSVSVVRGRNQIGGIVVPGFQTAFSGKQNEIQDGSTVRSDNVSGKVQNGKTLTMEMGVFYQRALTPDLYLGCSVNADILRPFNPQSFSGEYRLLPLNGQLSLRRVF